MKFHYEILSQKQKELLPFISRFKNHFFLGGWTAIALIIGHRKSTDFDLFKTNSDEIDEKFIFKKLKEFSYKLQNDTLHQKDLFVNEVKVSFIAFPFKIEDKDLILTEHFTIPSLLTLWAMKAYAMGRRPSRKDYIDMYFLLHKFPIEQIISKAKHIFWNQFNPKLFVKQLAFFDDIKIQPIEFMPWFNLSDEEIKSFLIEQSKKLLI